MSTQTKNAPKPFGIEFLETPQVPLRGTQVVTGPNDGCCNTYSSEIWGTPGTLDFDTPQGGAFCDDIDMCNIAT